jgi:hypothetical protein
MSDILAPNVFLHLAKTPLTKDTEDLAHTLYTYTVEVKEASTVEVTLDFTSEGKNIQVVNSTSGVVTATVMSYESRLVAIVRAYDVEWSTKCSVRIVKRPPSESAQQAIIGEEELARIGEEIRAA